MKIDKNSFEAGRIVQKLEDLVTKISGTILNPLFSKEDNQMLKSDLEEAYRLYMSSAIEYKIPQDEIEGTTRTYEKAIQSK